MTTGSSFLREVTPRLKDIILAYVVTVAIGSKIFLAILVLKLELWLATNRRKLRLLLLSVRFHVDGFIIYSAASQHISKILKKLLVHGKH